jgi:hypothetical protein
MAILNYTTKISSDKTVGEIQSLLGKKGVKSVSIDYSKSCPTAVLFLLEVGANNVQFRLPCNVEGVLKAMQNDRHIPRSSKTFEQAERTAWRIVKDWVEAQMAIIEAGQAVMEEVFLPYAVIPATNKTFFQTFTENSHKLLEK